MQRAAQLSAELEQYRSQQAALLGQLQQGLAGVTQGQHITGRPDASVGGIEAQIKSLGLLTHARSYVESLKRTSELVKQLERQVKTSSHQDADQLSELAAGAAERYSACLAELQQLTSSEFPPAAVPQQLRSMERALGERLETAQGTLHSTLSTQIHTCLEACSWPPPLVPSQAATEDGTPAFDPSTLFSPAHAASINTLQLLMKALTRLQLAAQKDAIAAAVQDGSSSSTAAAAAAADDPPLLWMAQELVSPLRLQLFEVFGSTAPGSPGALTTPEIVLGVVHRLALENVPRVDFLQGILQGLELHSAYQIGVEFTRALRDAVKQLLRQYKLPEVAASGDRDLWLAWIDALIAFEGSLGRSGLLGLYWDSTTSGGELPAVLLRGSTLTVLGEQHAWMDAWLQAEDASAAKQVEAVLYSEAAWGPGQQLVAEEGPAWQAEVWPPRGAEDVVALVEGLLRRLRFIPDAEAQQRYLSGAVGAVLTQAHGRIQRLLQQADLFRDITGCAWLPRVCTCICFCHYVEQQLQEMHDDAQVMVTRVDDQQQQEQQQQQQHGLDNGHAPAQQQQHEQQQQGATVPAALPPSANGNGPHAGRASANGSATQQQQQQQAAAAAAAAEAAAAKLRILSRPIGDFSSCRREWVLKLGKAAAMGFMQQAAGYVSRGALFKATTDALPALAADGELWSSGVVSGELQPALAWLATLLDALSAHLDKHCFRQAWGAAAAAINRELFNSVACEAVFSDAGALQLVIDQAALLGVFARFTARPAAYFKELGDAVKLLNLQQSQSEFVRQAVAASSRAPNAADVLKSVGVYHLDADLADTVLSLRLYQ